jgi:hypothetical protein
MKKMAIIIKKNKIMKNRKFILFFLDFSKKIEIIPIPIITKGTNKNSLLKKTNNTNEITVTIINLNRLTKFC